MNCVRHHQRQVMLWHGEDSETRESMALLGKEPKHYRPRTEKKIQQSVKSTHEVEHQGRETNIHAAENLQEKGAAHHTVKVVSLLRTLQEP